MHNEHIAARLRHLHDAVLSIVAVINRPDRDDLLIREAGIQLDRALFPLLVLVERYGPLGIVDLAGRVGRDHSVVSRQIAKLVELGLLTRKVGEADRRQRMAVATDGGRAMAGRSDAARERLGRKALAGWSTEEIDRLAQLMQRYAAALEAVADD